MNEFRAGLKLKPDYAETHYNLRLALKQEGEAEGAAAEGKRDEMEHKEHVNMGKP